MRLDKVTAVGLRRLSPTYIECITGVLKWKEYSSGIIKPHLLGFASSAEPTAFSLSGSRE